MRASILTLKRAHALRRKMTLPEVLLWQELRGGKLNGLQSRRQHPIGPYILDFFCPAARLAVEVDGRAHDEAEQVTHDQRRHEWLAGEGITVMRIAAVDILNRGKHGERACANRACGRPLHRLRRSPSPVNWGGAACTVFTP